MKLSDTELMLNGHGLVTAEITYRMPDFQSMLQVFTWQDYDLAPEFPKLHGFLDFWKESLDGPLHSVRYSHQKLIRAGEWRKVDGEILLH
ncbi:usg protein [Algicella marina]|uniref:Aspartate-semialdehyde dehydrogenase n=1 Tax=Algicella marina TaxID=2683284 RepID=A0A6P1T6T6_9RHOB|nr:usg protein [Algicella marina]QHQ36989.1 aspartate-semialdehyde dehydrogenase [Algicella marina]